MTTFDAIRSSRRLAVALVAGLGMIFSAVSAERASAFEVALQDDSVFLTQRFFYDQDKAYQQAASLGVTFIRTNVYWSDYYRSGYAPWDRLVAGARKYGISVQMTLCGTPALETRGNRKLNYKNPNVKLFASFAKGFAKHFKGKVRRYSIWNEPNYSYFLAPARKAPQIYRALYLAGYKAIKKVDSKNKVFIGEFGPNHDPLRFLARVSTGLRADGLAFHPFQWRKPAGVPVAERTHVGISNTPRIKATLNALRRSRGLRTPRGGTVPIYFTEFGYPSTVKLDGRTATDARRADWTVRAYKYAKKQGVKQLLYYTLVQPPRNTGIVFNSGMINSDGSPTAVYFSLRKYLKGY
jgi:hypothetical protein